MNKLNINIKTTCYMSIMPDLLISHFKNNTLTITSFMYNNDT